MLSPTFLVGILHTVATIRNVVAATPQPCAEVAKLLEVFKGKDLSTLSPPATVPAPLAYDCLNSVPLYRKEAIELVRDILRYLPWYASLADLKAPPKDYGMPPFDLIAGVQGILDRLEQDKYKNEYTFQLDLFQTVGRAYDGHTYFWPDLLTGVIAFAKDRKIALVSVSDDGLKLPKIHVYDRLISKLPSSPVVKINGVDATAYLDDMYKEYCQFTDRDTCYNNLLFSHQSLSIDNFGDFQSAGIGGFGSHGYIYPGPTTSLDLEDKTRLVLDNHAIVRKSFDGVHDGPSFYEKFCRPPKTPANAAATLNSNRFKTGHKKRATEKVSRVAGYPEPVLVAPDGSISGYYLTKAPFTDVAVLVLSVFTPDSLAEFQALAEDFIRKAKADHKTRIIIDVSGNTGGYTLSALDLFGQFFPQSRYQDFYRVRRTEAFDIMAAIASDPTLVKDPRDPKANADDFARWILPFNSRFYLNQGLKHFANVKEMLSGKIYKGDQYTAITRMDWESPYMTTNISGQPLEPTGFGTRKNFKQPFLAQDILILTDGICASACVTMSKNMIQRGAQTITFGGRPHLRQVQSLGGPRSMLAWNFQKIWDMTSTFYNPATMREKVVLDAYSDYPMKRATATGINVGDLLFEQQVTDGSQQSGQVTPVLADCKQFHTKATVIDVTEMWNIAANSRWGSGKCVTGGFKK